MGVAALAASAVRCRRCDGAISTRAKLGNTIRCPSCGYAQRLRPPGPAAPSRPGAPAGTWNPPGEPRVPGQSADPCPGCGVPAYASPRRTVRACLGCGGRFTPPGALAPYRREGIAAARLVKSQRERDLEALALARRKGLMLGQLAALAADGRLDPASVPVVEWFREQVKDAASDGRLDELAALLPEAGIRRRRWWQGQPAALTAGYDEDDDDEDQAEEDQAAGDTAPPAAPASTDAPRWRAPAGPMTWADAVAACGWRLAPTVGGCQVTDHGRLCGDGTAHHIATVTGISAWVCTRHYAALCDVLREHNRRIA